jgi:hypothetical protein
VWPMPNQAWQEAIESVQAGDKGDLI